MPRAALVKGARRDKFCTELVENRARDAQGRLKLEELISNRYPWGQINEAIASEVGGEALRKVIIFGRFSYPVRWRNCKISAAEVVKRVRYRDHCKVTRGVLMDAVNPSFRGGRIYLCLGDSRF